MWVGDTSLSDQDAQRRFTLKVLGAFAARYANDHGMEMKSSFRDGILNFVELRKKNKDSTKQTENSRLYMIITEENEWVDKPTSDGLWQYTRLDDNGEEVVGTALIELGQKKPIRAALGYAGVYDFNHSDFIGLWKKAVVPSPASGTSRRLAKLTT